MMNTNIEDVLNDNGSGVGVVGLCKCSASQTSTGLGDQDLLLQMWPCTSLQHVAVSVHHHTKPTQQNSTD